MDPLLKLASELLVKDCWLIPFKRVENRHGMKKKNEDDACPPQGWWDSTFRYEDFWFSCMCGKEKHVSLISCIFLLLFSNYKF